MNSIFSLKGLAILAMTVVILAVAFFAVLPVLSDLGVVPEVSLTALVAEACCGDGGGGEGGGEGATGFEVDCTFFGTCPPPPPPPPPPPSPSCDSFTATPDSLTSPGNVTLEWETTNANDVSLNNGIGVVPVDGSTIVNVTGDITYVLTVNGVGGSTQCQVSIEFEEEKFPSCDSFTATPNQINGPTDVTLEWETTNADTVEIDNGVGVVAEDGSTIVNVSGTITYTLTVSNAHGNDTCQVTITFEDDPSPMCDSFTATPSVISGPTDVTLEWMTTNADTVEIDNGVGVVPEDGSTVVNVTGTITYTLTVNGNNKTDTCQVTIEFDDDPQLSCDLFTASPSQVNPNDSTTLTWETTNATDVSIDNGIGPVSPDGSTSVVVTQDTTYTLSASDGVDTVTCTAPVTVNTGGGGGGGGGSSSPRCDLFEADKKFIEPGEDVTLRWETRRGRELKIDPIGFETDQGSEVREGSIVVNPLVDTRYTLTIERGSRQDTCIEEVLIGGPEVTVLSDRDQQPITEISFREIPYTGFEAGPFLTGLFYSLLALWGLAVAYILVIKKGTVFGFALPLATAGVTRREKGMTAIPHNEYYGAHADSYSSYEDDTETSAVETTYAHSVATAPANLPTLETQGVQQTADEDTDDMDDAEELAAYLETHAHAQRVLLSSDAIRMIARESEDTDEARDLLDEAIERAKEVFPREDGWIVLNRERLTEIFSRTEVAEEEPAAESTAEVPTTEEVAGASSLAEAIVTGNAKIAFDTLATGNPIITVAEAAEALDQVYRNRYNPSVAVNEMLKGATAHITDQKLEAAISALTSAVDGVYADEHAAIKVAVMKALKAVV